MCAAQSRTRREISPVDFALLQAQNTGNMPVRHLTPSGGRTRILLALLAALSVVTSPSGARPPGLRRSFPSGGLVIGRSGAMYGTTEYGGTSGNGTVLDSHPEGP